MEYFQEKVNIMMIFKSKDKDDTGRSGRRDEVSIERLIESNSDADAFMIHTDSVDDDFFARGEVILNPLRVKAVNRKREGDVDLSLTVFNNCTMMAGGALIAMLAHFDIHYMRPSNGILVCSYLMLMLNVLLAAFIVNIVIMVMCNLTQLRKCPILHYTWSISIISLLLFIINPYTISALASHVPGFECK